MVLHGVDRLGGSHHTPTLNHDDSRDNHDKGDIDAISFSGLQDVGELTKIAITHDGKGDGWGLKQVEVLCMENGKVYKAYCDAWLDNATKTFNLLPG